MSVPRFRPPVRGGGRRSGPTARTGSWDAISSEGYHPVAPPRRDDRRLRAGQHAGRILTLGFGRVQFSATPSPHLRKVPSRMPDPDAGNGHAGISRTCHRRGRSCRRVTAMVRRCYDVGDDVDDLRLIPGEPTITPATRSSDHCVNTRDTPKNLWRSASARIPGRCIRVRSTPDARGVVVGRQEQAGRRNGYRLDQPDGACRDARGTSA